MKLKCCCYNGCCADACRRVIEEVQVDLNFDGTTVSETFTLNASLRDLNCWVPLKVGCTQVEIERALGPDPCSLASDYIRDIRISFSFPDADADDPAGVLQVIDCDPKSIRAMLESTVSGSYNSSQEWYWADERYVSSEIDIKYKDTELTLDLDAVSGCFDDGEIADAIESQLQALGGTYPEIATVEVTVETNIIEDPCTALWDETLTITHSYHESVGGGVYVHNADFVDDHRLIFRGLIVILHEENDKDFYVSVQSFIRHEYSGDSYGSTVVDEADESDFDPSGSGGKLELCCERESRVYFSPMTFQQNYSDAGVGYGPAPSGCINPTSYSQSASRFLLTPEIKVKIVWAADSEGTANCNEVCTCPMELPPDAMVPSVTDPIRIGSIELKVGTVTLTYDCEATESTATTDFGTDNWPPDDRTVLIRPQAWPDGPFGSPYPIGCPNPYHYQMFWYNASGECLSAFKADKSFYTGDFGYLGATPESPNTAPAINFLSMKTWTESVAETSGYCPATASTVTPASATGDIVHTEQIRMSCSPLLIQLRNVAGVYSIRIRSRASLGLTLFMYRWSEFVGDVSNPTGVFRFTNSFNAKITNPLDADFTYAQSLLIDTGWVVLSDLADLYDDEFSLGTINWFDHSSGPTSSLTMQYTTCEDSCSFYEEGTVTASGDYDTYFGSAPSTSSVDVTLKFNEMP